LKTGEFSAHLIQQNPTIGEHPAASYKSKTPYQINGSPHTMYVLLGRGACVNDSRVAKSEDKDISTHAVEPCHPIMMGK
jgi:hypothetical protein